MNFTGGRPVRLQVRLEERNLLVSERSARLLSSTVKWAPPRSKL